MAGIVVALLAACAGGGRAGGRAGAELKRSGDEIVICGRMFHTGAPVVLWMDPGGYDAYRVERRFVPIEEAGWERSAGKVKTPNRYGVRGIDVGSGRPTSMARGSAGGALGAEEFERVRGGGWDLPTLQRVVDQFVIHYDVCGTSRTCFRVLHDVRGLSVHFLLDIDGTIYQTMDVKEKAWHATVCNDRSVGVEIANMGAYGVKEKDPLARWYTRDADGSVRIMVPPELDGGGVRTAGFVGRPARPEMVVGRVQGMELRQWDFTPEQYESLEKLTAALCTALPRIRCDWPRDESGAAIEGKLSEEQLESYSGLLGHYHIQKEKVDPGPAFEWEKVVEGARGRMGKQTAIDIPARSAAGSM